MRHLVAALVGSVVLGAAGFAAASAVDATKKPGEGGTAATTGAAVTGTAASHKVLICHRTGSTKKPQRTISVDQHALPAHMAHHDMLGACPTTTTIPQATTQSTTMKTEATETESTETKSKGSKSKATTSKVKKVKTHGKAAGKGKFGTHGNSGSHGKSSNHGNSGSHGNGGGHGKGK